MAKKKHPIFRLHKIKVHHNRWLIWAIAYVLFVTIALVGYIKITDEDVTEVQAEQVFRSWGEIYQNQKLGFSLRYPAHWEATADDVSVVVGPETGDEAVEVSVYRPTAERTIRKPLKILEEQPLVVDGREATQITNDIGNGKTESVVLVKTDAHIYVIRGEKSNVNKILLTFNLTK